MYMVFTISISPWQRQKKGNPVNQLKVTFIGEAGVDSTALRKEFLTETISGIEISLFLGQRAKSPQCSNNDLDNGLFRTAGEIFAVSLAQGGPAPCFMREWCYFYLTTEEVDVLRICKDDVDNIEYSLLISKVEEATDLTEFTDEMISCEYTGALNIEQKDAIIRGCGVRWLNIIPPDSEGYTGPQIKSASASGKTMLYVVPLQEELDLNPLPNDARE
ncbi:uncharacterized protein LOC107694502 [Sinocyclocheilus anshuiensis]|uniref:uncharacterized protein LOC107694502 n=1 Tax=Sinocyclocheilus anshuiensis TaxID=1608454 RepID=UPI0007BA72C9|nr:PREDICTED: uncharacterized protein LOC107694502 [Sinocyclocheilus anshuiensis]